MSETSGRHLKLSGPRRTICDLLHFAQKVPTVPVQRIMNVASLARARKLRTPAISWAALFLRAYGITAQAFPELRRSYLSFPYPRLFEHPYNVASIAIERRHNGENAVFFAHIRTPETQPLEQLQQYLDKFKNDPVESFGLFRRSLTVARMPRFLRRFFWWYGLNVSGPKKTKRIGTFSMSVYSGLGAESLHPLSPLTSTLHYGVIGETGDIAVRITYDHRVLDGSTVARALAHLENVLNNQIVAELEQLATRKNNEAA